MPSPVYFFPTSQSPSVHPPGTLEPKQPQPTLHVPTGAEHWQFVIDYVKAELKAFEELEAHIKAAQQDDDDVIASSSEKLPKYSFGNIIFRSPRTTKATLFKNFQFDVEHVNMYSPLFTSFDFNNQLQAFLAVHQQEIGEINTPELCVKHLALILSL